MKKMHGCESAYWSLRVGVGCSFFLGGVFLALFAVANPTDGSRSGFTAANQSSSGGTILFNQLTGFTLGSVPSQRFNPPGSSDAEAAEDFMVFDSQGWTIGQFDFELGLTASEPDSVDVRVYSDNNGHPGSQVLCSYDGIATTVHGFQQPVMHVPLSTPCVLNQGRYWISVVRSDGSGMQWADGSPNPFPPPFVLGQHGHWRNPGNGYETGCTDWSDITTCLVTVDKEPVPIGGSGTDFKFQICGTVGVSGNAVGCPDQNFDTDLAITLAVDNGDPQQCGTATTLEVDAGQRVNTCYTITNTGDTNMLYHWVRDGRPPRPFAKNQFLQPGESFHFNRVITADESQIVTADAQSTDAIPWYFAAVNNFQFIDISSSGTALNLGDDGSANLILPFQFNLFGVSSDHLCINNNGFILLDWSESCDGYYEDAAIPNETVPLRSNQIAPYWDDLFTGGNVYYAVVGQQPTRKFIVQWHQKNHYNNGLSDPGTVTFEAILDEATNDISHQYLDTTFDNPQHPEWDRAGSATVGFQSYVRDGFGGPWRSLNFHQPTLNSNSGLTWPATRFFHSTAVASATLSVRAPIITVSPEAIQATVPPGGSTSRRLTISNTGTLNLQWQVGESPLGPMSHFPLARIPISEGETMNGNTDLWDKMPAERAKLHVDDNAPISGVPDSFATRAFAVRYAFNTPPFPTLYQRLNDITNPSNTETIGDLVARDIFAGAFIGNDFTRQFGIDDCCANFLSIDTTTGVPTMNMGRVQRDPSQLARFWGMTWDATTGNLYTVVSNTFSILSNTRFFLVRLDRGHNVVAVVIGELPGIPQGVAMFGIAVDSIGRMFGIDVLGDRLFAIDKNSAQISPIGPLGFSANGALGFDFDDAMGTLYLTTINDASSTSNLYTVNTLTGQATLVGPLVNGNQHSALAIASGAPCVPPSEVPWLSLSPSSGIVLPNQSTNVTVTMNATALPIGTHQADVCVGSNDALSPLVAVPVTLTVGASPTPSATPTPATISISGSIAYCSNPSLNPVPNVVMTLTGSASSSTLTDGSGNYSFTSLPAGGSYTVTPSKSALPPGSAGINTTDVVAAQRHFLNITSLPPGCRLTAADVNGDTTLNTIDIIAIQRFFLGLSTGIANTGKYNFNPVSRSYPSVVSNQVNQNYNALVFGDVALGFVHRPGGSSGLTGDLEESIPLRED